MLLSSQHDVFDHVPSDGRSKSLPFPILFYLYIKKGSRRKESRTYSRKMEKKVGQPEEEKILIVRFGLYTSKSSYVRTGVSSGISEY